MSIVHPSVFDPEARAGIDPIREYLLKWAGLKLADALNTGLPVHLAGSIIIVAMTEALHDLARISCEARGAAFSLDELLALISQHGDNSQIRCAQALSVGGVQ